MHTDGKHPEPTSDSAGPAELAHTIRSARLRGLMRHSWLNEGFDAFPLAARIHWSTSIDEANRLRTKLGLPSLDLSQDPAPDVAAQWTSDSESSFSTPIYTARDTDASGASRGIIALPLMDALQWTGPGRLLTFLLAATSIGCMLVDNVGIVTVRSFFFAVLAPACIALVVIAYLNRIKGDGRLFRAVFSGAIAGLAGALVFNIFRLPFVYSHELGLDRLGISQVPFFNLYPRIGSLLLGQPVKQPSYELQTYFVGWGYHLIRAMPTGIMFAAAIGEIRAEITASTPLQPISLRAITRGALLTVAIQACLLLSPYAKLFSIELTPQRIFIILLAHVCFGVSISFFYAWRAGTLERNSLAQMA